MKHLATIAIVVLSSVSGSSIAVRQAAAQDQSQSQDTIYQPNKVTVKAKITRKVEPRYTEEARRNGTSGRVIVRVVLRASGEVTDIVILQGLPHGLNDSAVRAAQETRFEPAIRDDRKVSQYLRLEYGFRIH
ncbi:MAG: energy transducer TonB [Pyrinomonadaceae bacterium]